MKNYIACILCFFGSLALVSAQEKELLIKVDSMIPVQNNCKALPLSHWSFGLKGGASYFMIPPNAPNQADRLNISYGGQLEYTINPFIGLGLEYDRNDYSRPYEFEGTAGQITGLTNDYILFGSVNLSNSICPNRRGSWKFLNVYGDVGTGLASYSSHLNNKADVSNNTTVTKLGLNVEFTLSDALNLGIAGQYNQYGTRFMSTTQNSINDDALLFTIGLRYKFLSKTKNHARNVSPKMLTPEPESIVVIKTYEKGDTDDLLNRVKTAESENAANKKTIEKMEEDLKRIGN